MSCIRIAISLFRGRASYLCLVIFDPGGMHVLNGLPLEKNLKKRLASISSIKEFMSYHSDGVLWPERPANLEDCSANQYEN